MYSAEELQKPPVIDLETLLQPISEENPSGESVRYSGIYDEIMEARRADEGLGDYRQAHELKTADFYKVIELADSTLKTETKDLQIAAWFSEALAEIHGFVGLRDSLKLLSGLQVNFWETLFPEIEEGDMEGRANALAFVDKQTTVTLKKQPITAGQGLNYFQWEESKRFDIPESIDTLDYNDQKRYNDLKQQAETENRITGEIWRSAKAQSRRAFYEEMYFVLEECWEEYQNLNRVNDEKFDRNQVPGLNNLKQALEDIRLQVKKLLDEKRLEEPDEVDETEGEGAGDGEIVGEDGTILVAVAGKKGPIQSRQDALKRLSEVAEYFRKTEPHSPVSYLVSRAVKWGGMPLESWLQDVIKDETVIYQLRETLGIGAASEDGDVSGE